LSGLLRRGRCGDEAEGNEPRIDFFGHPLTWQHRIRGL